MDEKIEQRNRFTLAQLEVFTAIARGGAMRTAAGKLARSHSATSSALRELETALGVQLFDRVGRKLLLNENGRAFLPKATAIVEQAHDASALFHGSQAAPLRIAASYTVGEYLLPGLIVQWKARHGQAQVRLDIANTADVFAAVASFTAEAGFIEGEHTHPDLLVRRWRTDQLCVVASPRHPLAKQRVSLARLGEAGWILREPGSGTRDASDRWLIRNLAQVTLELELGSNEAVKRAVAAGSGLGCLSRLAVQDAIASGWLVELKTALPPMRRTLSTVVHRQRQPGRQVKEFLEHCREAED